MAHIEITKEMIQNANDYIPLIEKQALTEKLAQRCIARVNVGFTLDGDQTSHTMPERYQEMRHMTAMFQMGVFAKLYLKQEFFGDDDLQMAANVYDDWAGSHVFNQLERLKTDKDVKDKVFNILYDYKEFQWAMRREIETLIGHNNDTVLRLGIFFAESAKNESLGAMNEFMGANGNNAEAIAAKVAAVKADVEKMEVAKAGVEEAKEGLTKLQEAAIAKRALADKLTDELAAKRSGVGRNVRSDKQ